MAPSAPTAPPTGSLPSKILRLCSVAGSAVLLVAVSWEILTGDHRHFSQAYLLTQFAVCLVFLADVALDVASRPRSRKVLGHSFVLLLLSIPYLNLIAWCGWDPGRQWMLLIGAMPLVRSYLALYIIIRWMVRDRYRHLLTAYLLTVVLFTYLSALIFFDCEVTVNPHLHGFGNALWWAWMNVTTVGAAIFPVTAAGKVICVLLPIVGMIFFPVFTVYISQYYTRRDA